MLTFDAHTELFSFDDFRKSRMPDVIEVGETEDYWVRVMRSTGRIDLVSKVSGRAFAFCAYDGDEARFLLSAAQLSAVRAAMRLG